jgi:chromosomal replication initiation ATPase DnaA
VKPKVVKPYEDFEAWEAKLQDLGIHDDFTAVCGQRGVSLREVYSDARMKPISDARGRLMLYCRSILKWSFPYIGCMFKRDHTSVMYSVQKLQGRSKPSRSKQKDTTG